MPTVEAFDHCARPAYRIVVEPSGADPLYVVLQPSWDRASGGLCHCATVVHVDQVTGLESIPAVGCSSVECVPAPEPGVAWVLVGALVLASVAARGSVKRKAPPG